MKLADGVVFANFDVAEGGVYYIDRAARDAGGFFSDRTEGDTRLRYYDFATEQAKTVATNLGVVTYGLSASPDGRTVYFSRVDSAVDELMLVENFR